MYFTTVPNGFQKNNRMKHRKITEWQIMVLTAVGDIAYRRKDDDVIVCPVAALKP